MKVKIVNPGTNFEIAEIEIDTSKIDASKFSQWSKLIVEEIISRFKIDLTAKDITKIKFRISEDEEDEQKKPVTISDDSQPVPVLTEILRVSLRLSNSGNLKLTGVINKQKETNKQEAMKKLNAIFAQFVMDKVIDEQEKLSFSSKYEYSTGIDCNGKFTMLQLLRGVFAAYAIEDLTCDFMHDENILGRRSYLSIEPGVGFENLDCKKLAAELHAALLAQKQLRDMETNLRKEVCAERESNDKAVATVSSASIVGAKPIIHFNRKAFTSSAKTQEKEIKRHVFCMKPLNTNHVLISFTSGEIEVWDSILGRCIKTYKVPKAYDYHHIPLTVLSDNIVIASIMQRDNRASILKIIDFKPDTPKELYSLIFGEKIYALTANLKRKVLVTCAHKNNIYMDATNDVLMVSALDMNSNSKISINIHNTMRAQGRVLHLMTTIDDNVVSATDTGHIQKWDVVKRRCIQTISTDGTPISSIVELPNGDLAYANSSGIFASDPKTSRLVTAYDSSPLARGNSKLAVLGGRFLVAILEQTGVSFKAWDLVSNTPYNFTFDESNDCRTFTGFNSRVLIGNRFSELASYTFPVIETFVNNSSPALSPKLPPAQVVAFSKGGSEVAVTTNAKTLVTPTTSTTAATAAKTSAGRVSSSTSAANVGSASNWKTVTSDDAGDKKRSSIGSMQG